MVDVGYWRMSASVGPGMVGNVAGTAPGRSGWGRGSLRESSRQKGGQCFLLVSLPSVAVYSIATVGRGNPAAGFVTLFSKQKELNGRRRLYV